MAGVWLYYHVSTLAICFLRLGGVLSARSYSYTHYRWGRQVEERCSGAGWGRAGECLVGVTLNSTPMSWRWWPMSCPVLQAKHQLCPGTAA